MKMVLVIHNFVINESNHIYKHRYVKFFYVASTVLLRAIEIVGFK